MIIAHLPWEIDHPPPSKMLESTLSTGNREMRHVYYVTLDACLNMIVNEIMHKKVT